MRAAPSWIVSSIEPVSLIDTTLHRYRRGQGFSTYVTHSWGEEIWLVNLVGKHILRPGSRNLESWSFVGVKEKKKKHCFITELIIYFNDVCYLQVTTFFRTNI